jgi:hypothetical protein
MPLIRGHHEFDDHYAQIPNAWLRDDRLSLEARGLLAQIMSHRPGWNLSLKTIALQNKIGRDKVRRILAELIEHNYLERSDRQNKDEQGRMTSYDYITRDPAPRSDLPCTENPYTDKPYTVIGPPKKTKVKEDYKEENNSKEIDQAFTHFWEIYPRKVGKEQARKAFMSNKANIEAVMDGVRRMAADPNLPDKQFIPHASTWLNRGGWEDEPYPEQNRRLTNAEKAAQIALKYVEQERAMGGYPEIEGWGHE